MERNETFPLTPTPAPGGRGVAVLCMGTSDGRREPARGASTMWRKAIGPRHLEISVSLLEPLSEVKHASFGRKAPGIRSPHDRCK